MICYSIVYRSHQIILHQHYNEISLFNEYLKFIVDIYSLSELSQQPKSNMLFASFSSHHYKIKSNQLMKYKSKFFLVFLMRELEFQCREILPNLNYL